MAEKLQYSEFFVQVADNHNETFARWLHRIHADTLVRECSNGLIQARIHMRDPVYQSNLKKSLRCRCPKSYSASRNA